MGTGGIIPTTINQSVTLYNTTGVIEREKGIYFCPFIHRSETGTVKDSWLTKFTNALPSVSNDYKDISISVWNPKDRTLLVKGNADDFRLKTEEGLCLNYLILKRTVDNVEHAYAFFINEVEQAGNGSVRLSLQEDHFTNVFYLHNTKLCSEYTEDIIDVFNEKLKNCYVERQHYNRVKIVRGEVEALSTITALRGDMKGVEEGHLIVSFDVTPYLDLTKGLPELVSATVGSVVVRINSQFIDVTSNIQSYRLVRNNNSYNLLMYINTIHFGRYGCTDLNITVRYNNIVEDNLPIFSQIEESFKYKRQFRDYKEYINYGNPVTEEEKQAYAEAESWNDLTSELKIKALKLSTAFLHIVFKTNKIFMKGQSSTQRTRKNLIPNTRVQEHLVTCCLPIYHKIGYLEKFESEISIIFRNIKLISIAQVTEEERITNMKFGDFYYYNGILEESSAFTEYIVSAYLSKESNIIDKMTYTDSDISVKLLSSSSTNNLGEFYFLPNISILPEGQQAEVIQNLINGSINYYAQTVDNVLTYTFNGWTPENRTVSPLIIEHLGPKTFNLDLTEKPINDIKEKFYDTVLSFNPYSFYSVSYLGRIEVPLNKLNYYENPIIKCDLTIHTSDIFKYSFIPTYDINGLSQKMYSESLEQAFANQLTLINSKLAEYVIANQSQMRNQYAINNVDAGYGLVTSAVSGIGDIAGGALKGGLVSGGNPVGAVIGGAMDAIKTVTNLANVGIGWDKNKKEIEMNQKAKLADMGTLPSNLKQAGTDITIDMSINEIGLYLNHYRIDGVSYNSICKYLERFGYVVNIFDNLNVNSRVGWDYIQLVSFDYDSKITVEQEEIIRQIFQNGVTLLHDKTVMNEGHNYEVILDE